MRSPLARLEFAVELARTSDNRNASLDRIKRDLDRLGTLVGELFQVTRAEGGDPALCAEERRRRARFASCIYSWKIARWKRKFAIAAF